MEITRLEGLHRGWQVLRVRSCRGIGPENGVDGPINTVISTRTVESSHGGWREKGADL